MLFHLDSIIGRRAVATMSVDGIEVRVSITLNHNGVEVKLDEPSQGYEQAIQLNLFD
jgi:hypothetical protein